MLARLRAEVESAQPELLPWLSLIAIVFDIEVAAVDRGRAAGCGGTRDQAARGRPSLPEPALVVPTIMEIEQGHLMDAASVALFEALARELESSAWVVVVTRHDTPGGMVPDGAVPCLRIELGALCPRRRTRSRWPRPRRLSSPRTWWSSR